MTYTQHWRSASVAFSLLFLLTWSGQAMALPEYYGNYKGRTNQLQRRLQDRDFSIQGQAVRDYLDAISEEGIHRWAPESFPIKVYIEPGDDVPGYRENYPDILRSAFDKWVAASGNRLGWVEVKRPQGANLICGFTDDAPDRTGGTEAGRTRTNSRFNTDTNEGTIYRGTMRLATRLPDRELSDEEVQKTFLHEVGHAFGLPGHSPNRTDIMYAKVSPSQQPQLSARDVATIQRLYGTYPRRSGIASTPRTVDSGVSVLDR